MLYEKLAERQTASELIFDGRILHLYRDDIELPNGKPADRELIRHVGAVCVIPVTDDGYAVMERQYRYPVDEVVLEIPAGKLDSPDEDPFLCAKRELSEETGLVAQHWEKLTCLETTPGFCNERIHIYFATGLSQGSVHPDEDEFVSTVRMPLKDAVARVMDGTFRDAKTALAIMMAAAKCAQ